MPLLSTTGPVQGTEPRRERPRCRCPCPSQRAAPGSFTSRFHVFGVALQQRADRARGDASISPQRRGHRCRKRRRSDLGLFGSEAAR